MDRIRAVEVPGERVVDAYCALVDAINDTVPGSEAERIAEAKAAGFRQAVEIYCPDTPGYSCTAGHLLMAADRHTMSRHGEDAAICGGVLLERPARSNNGGRP